jgi:UDP-N-acetylglucosamine 2-epimerase (non-hydrolysing)
MKILLVFGTRPEAVKMAPLIKVLKTEVGFDVKVCVTAQHREMLDQTLNFFDIQPDIDLDLMRTNQDLFDITSKILIEMREVIRSTGPDIILVHGDTTTCMAVSMASFYLGIPLGHIEAGLRTFDMTAPFPEEFNRRLTGMIARLHFAPTQLSKNNLIAEGVLEDRIYVTGNTGVDALKLALNKINSNAIRLLEIEEHLDGQLGFNWKSEKFILITGHRRENFGSGFISICKAIASLAKSDQSISIVYPVHLNPNVQKPVKQLLSSISNVYLIDPLDYEFFIYLLSKAHIVVTDSGGIQEEAPSLGKPVLVMRDVTERPEAVNAGTVRLVGSSEASIIAGVRSLLDDQNLYQRMSRSHNPYGDGTASMQIKDALLEYRKISSEK